MGTRGEVLVAIMNNKADWHIACQQNWYRIPLNQVKKRLKDRFPPQWLAFYKTKVFGEEAFAINYYAKVVKVTEVCRWQLFPDEPKNKKTNQKYCKLEFTDLKSLDQPILSRRLRRLVFIPTTLEKLLNAVEINDIWDESPLEDRVWAELKRLEIKAERQEYVKLKKKDYFLDFAIYCEKGKINIETDGDSWHANKKQAVIDNERDNDLETAGWRTLRFSTYHVQEKMADYCVPKIVENINNLGGIKEHESSIPKKIQTGQYKQLSLFDD